ncbi:MAG: DKNYY domain-containing protein [Pseudomonadota bacterium]|nr:DKNYY domain-containing protein [Pseudomonadota bacterium]
MMMLLLLFKPRSGSMGSGQFNENQRVNGSYFYRQQNQIYVSVPSDGMVPVPEADPDSFTALNGDNAQIGRDNTQVFCGHQVLPGLQPPVQALGNDLYSDGRHTYYCDHFSERRSAGFGGYIGAYVRQAVAGRHISHYHYPFRLLDDTGKTFRALPHSQWLSTDGSRFYYRGEPIADAQHTPFPIIDSRHEARAYEVQTQTESREALQRDSRASPYLADGSRVFYQARLLDVPDDEALRTLHYAAWGGFDMLYHAQGGALFVDGESVNPDRPPYRLLSRSDSHAQHLFFSNAKGLYFYDHERRRARKVAGNRLPWGDFEEIDDGYLSSNGSDLIFFLLQERWAHRSGLTGYRTQIARLADTAPGRWQRWGEPHWHLWQKGDAVYYFNTLERSRHRGGGVYLVPQPKRLGEQLQQSSPNTDTVEHWIEQGLLLPAEHDIVATAESKRQNDTFKIVMWILLSAAALGWGVYRLLLKSGFNLDPFVIENGYLRINNALGRKYPLADIGHIRFSIRQHYFGLTSGRLQVVLRDGACSMAYVFVPTKALLANKPRLEAEIIRLQALLSLHGVVSEYRREE